MPLATRKLGACAWLRQPHHLLVGVILLEVEAALLLLHVVVLLARVVVIAVGDVGDGARVGWVVADHVPARHESSKGYQHSQEHLLGAHPHNSWQFLASMGVYQSPCARPSCGALMHST